MEDHASAGLSCRVSGRGWLAFFTGLNLAFAACYMMCKPSWNHPLSWSARLADAVFYLVVVCAVGGLATWIALPGTSREQFQTIFRGGIRGWIFMPAIALFLQAESIWAQLVAVAAAALMALYLHRSAALDTPPEAAPRGLFASEIRVAPQSPLAFVLSLLLYVALFGALDDRMVVATASLAAVSFLVVLRLASARAERPKRAGPPARKARPYVLFAASFYLILIALSPTPTSGLALLGLHGAAPKSAQTKQPADPHASSLGFRTIVLWPPEKREKIIVAPAPKAPSTTVGVAKPMVIPFFGPYWYFKYPGEQPGPNTRTSHGDPLKANVRSTDSYPLLMEAHQHLDDPIELACCREIQIVLRNDPSAGALAVGIELIDSTSAARLSQDLGIRVVPASLGDQGPAVEETLTFQIPRRSLIGRFDDINVTFVPDPRRRTAARKVAVERFVLVP